MATEHPKRIGDYDVLGKLGKGGMGSVYKAVQPSLNRIVAIKVLAESLDDETSVERFRREAKAVALLNHPNVVQVIDMSDAEGNPYFVMEYVKGTSLDAIMQRRRLSLTEAVGVFKEVCKGLQAAHRQNIVHRDLNPRNVLVSEDLSVVKLADFGISRVEAISRTEGTLTTGTLTMGTLHYMAPEQARGMAEVDHRADIYSLGVLLYEMLTGRIPVGRFNLPSQLEEGVPPELDPLVLRCLSAEPGDRYPTVDRVLEAVTKLEDQLRMSFAQDFKGLSRSTSKLFSRSTSTVRGKPLMWAIGAAAAIAIGGVLFFVLRQSPAPAQSAPPEVGEVVLAEAVERFRPGGSEEGVAVADIAPPELEEEAPAPTPASARPVQPVETAQAPAAAPPPATTGSAGERADLEAAVRKAEAGLAEQAKADLTGLIESASKPVAAEALLELADIHEQAGQTSEAMASLIEFGAKFPDAKGAAEAQFRLGKLLRSLGKSRHEAARDAFTQLVSGYPSSEYVPAALAHRAAIENEMKLTVQDSVLGRSVPASLVSLRMLVERFPTDRAAENAGWELAEGYRDLNLHAEAAAAYQRLGQSFPRTRHDAWWHAGQLLEDKLSDDAGALAAYQKVPESSRNHGKAQRRVRKLSG